MLSTAEQPVVLQPEDADFIWGLFHEFVDRSLAFVRSRCSQAMPTTEICQVVSLSKLLQVKLGLCWAANFQDIPICLLANHR